MISDPYNSLVRELFAEPAHAGDAGDDIIGYVVSQGVRIQLSATVAGGIITGLRFRAMGCPHVIAATEAFCRHFEGQPAAALEQFSTARIMEDLAVPVEKTGRILVLEDAVRSLGQAIQDRLTTNQQD